MKTRSTFIPMRKTSVQLDPEQINRARSLYPTMTISEIARMAIDYVVETKPKPMPPRFAKACDYSGCSRLTLNGAEYCDVHAMHENDRS